MKKLTRILVLLAFPVLAKCQGSSYNTSFTIHAFHQENDSIVWQTSSVFCKLFEKADTDAMKQFLPEDFLLQWMHENFIGKKEIISAMSDKNTRTVMAFRIKNNNSTIIRYSDDQSAASMSTTFEFSDPDQMKSIEKQHGYGLCIFYLKKENTLWVLKTVHIDLHCSLCNF
ncbi:MAG TPA: hypothetical protein VMT76_02210 [Puia sp.]|nr:hypothetical protein [Puia sp.]